MDSLILILKFFNLLTLIGSTFNNVVSVINDFVETQTKFRFPQYFTCCLKIYGVVIELLKLDSVLICSIANVKKTMCMYKVSTTDQNKRN